MSWCHHCLTDHAGLCLDERRRLEFRMTLRATVATSGEPCPYCGVDGEQCPIRHVERARCGPVPPFALSPDFSSSNSA
jgi:hypothetical protein